MCLSISRYVPTTLPLSAYRVLPTAILLPLPTHPFRIPRSTSLWLSATPRFVPFRDPPISAVPPDFYLPTAISYASICTDPR
eukprot:788738-Rhodomonas_salina.2